MSNPLAYLLILSLALLGPGAALAQPSYSRGVKPSKKEAPKEEASEDTGSADEESASEDEEPAKKPAKKKSRGEDEDEDAKPLKGRGSSDPQGIKAYLDGRLGQIKRSFVEQESFGKKLSGDWQQFWGKIYEERKVFEIRMARQRINLFESLSSLDSRSHGETIGDYERLQANQIKAFEQGQKDKMSKFFTEVDSNMKRFENDQERLRTELLAQSVSSWESQKKGTARSKAAARKKAQRDEEEDESYEEEEPRPKPAKRKFWPWKR